MSVEVDAPDEEETRQRILREKEIEAEKLAEEQENEEESEELEKQLEEEIRGKAQVFGQKPRLDSLPFTRAHGRGTGEHIRCAGIS